MVAFGAIWIFPFKYSGSCSESDAAAGECFGGVSRIRSKVDELRSEYNNSILLDGGDQYQGTLWFYKFGGQIHAHFMNIIGYDAIGLGNHEFDNGVSGLVPFVVNASFAVLSSNIDLSDTPLQGKIAKSKTFTIGGEKIGVIGYTTKSTPYISNPGDAPSTEQAQGSYPFVVKTSASGENVLVVQDYAFGKYLGRLHVNFDDAGKVTNFNGNPVLLDGSVPKDPELESMVHSLLPQIEALQNEPVGSTHVLLQGDRKVCRVRECNLGNLICDGMLRQNLRHSDDTYWSAVGIAVVNAGGIRSSLNIGAITVGDVIKVHPFRNTVDIVELRGEAVLKMLEHAAFEWTQDVSDLSGSFLQVSGMRIVYDMTRAPGSRVVDVQMRCSKCKIPHFEPLNKTEVYQIVMNEFMVSGKDGYSMIPEEMIRKHTIGNVDLEILIDTIKQDSPVIQGLEDRIRFLHEIKEDSLISKLVQEKECVSDSAPSLTFTLPFMTLGLLLVLNGVKLLSSEV
ncbi:LOW QUALITY PROTEIN: 5'-nucleotidase [Elysia marginata]|uniref:5'-nucleotidase n=1 Tax=Elysia marginata TaxID=1093978 RepID=A0AAV4FKK9_9GAST|nr:LOW QUALITY PROTEIN: 5'-nucleotidase [Elysia marginata]